MAPYLRGLKFPTESVCVMESPANYVSVMWILRELRIISHMKVFYDYERAFMQTRRRYEL